MDVLDKSKHINDKQNNEKYEKQKHFEKHIEIISMSIGIIMFLFIISVIMYSTLNNYYINKNINDIFYVIFEFVVSIAFIFIVLKKFNKKI